eukprot:3359991-Heterocapsa_arctica.AAC.1
MSSLKSRSILEGAHLRQQSDQAFHQADLARQTKALSEARAQFELESVARPMPRSIGTPCGTRPPRRRSGPSS